MDTVVTSLEGLQQALNSSRVGYELRRVPAASTDQWSIVDGALQHRSKGFFSVCGVSPMSAASESVLLYQPQAAVTGLLTSRVEGERCFLLQARAEPGCVGEAQFGPTVQSTPANFLRLHGGASTPFVEMFIAYDPTIALLSDTTQLDLGKRYLFKTKRSILLETEVPTPSRSGYVWATRHAVSEAARRSAFLNIDLRSLLSIADWASDDEVGELAPSNDMVRRSLSAPVRAEIVGDVVADLARYRPAATRFVPLESLENWCLTDWGISERVARQNFAIDFFEVRAPLREVAHWVQPLVNSSSQGQAVLAARQRHGALEFFVRPLCEMGLATGAALAPSHLRYPGEPEDTPDWLIPLLSNPWLETSESDEGGRFFQDVSRYQIVVCRDGGTEPPARQGHWLRLSELKLFLRASNTCTIQLRALISHLLAAL